jgi:mono/diheme cytochrome c family protein
MMFVTGDDELREYVLDGAPERKHTDADYRAEMANQAIQMPGFRGYITEGELDEVIEYVRATSGMLPPPDGPIARGATLATQFGCFACHGELGIGGRPNPGALKGYIPGFFGHDFTDLVRSEDELLEWIREGGIDRIRRHPIGGYFFGRQRIAMPAYKRFASEEEIRDLAAYVRWLSEEHWRQIPLTH